MTSRIARIDPMTNIPPRVTNRRAQRSVKSRRRVWECAPPRNRGERLLFLDFKLLRSPVKLLELLELLLHDRCLEREVAVLDDDLLAFPRQDQLDELPDQRIERLVGGLVDVDHEV